MRAGKLDGGRMGRESVAVRQSDGPSSWSAWAHGEIPTRRVVDLRDLSILAPNQMVIRSAETLDGSIGWRWSIPTPKIVSLSRNRGKGIQKDL